MRVGGCGGGRGGDGMQQKGEWRGEDTKQGQAEADGARSSRKKKQPKKANEN